MSTRSSVLILMVCAAIGCHAHRAQAVLLAYDPFKVDPTPEDAPNRPAGEYTVPAFPGDTAGDVRQQGAAAMGWVGTQGIDGFGVAHTGSTANFAPNALGEDSAAVDYEQTGRLQWLGAGTVFNRNITRQLSSTVTSTASAEWWFSIMVNRVAWATTQSSFAVGGFTNAANVGLQVGYADASVDGVPALILRSNNINTVLVPESASSDNHYILMKLDINETGNDTITVWVDPDSVATLPAADLVINDQDLFSTLNPFTQSRYESPGPSGVVFFDEIRLGTTFEAVAEPPAPPVLLGDFNGDQLVDAADYTIWRDALGDADETALMGAGDGLNGVDSGDYDVWFANFGATAAASAGLSANSVPEPSTVLLLVGAACGAVGLRRGNRVR